MKKTIDSDDDIFVLKGLENGIVLIELKSCRGRYKIQMAQSYDKLIREHFDHTYSFEREGAYY